MSDDDPFSEEPDPEATVIRPSPGRKSRQSETAQATPAPAPAPAPGSAPTGKAVLAENLIEGGKSPLIAAATTILGIIKQLRNNPAVSDIAGLRNRVIRGMQNFETRARNFGCDADTVHTARYCLCTSLDEVVLLTPWGSGSLWAKQSLLSSFHNETWGGEKFFVILKQLQQTPGKHLPLLELMYLCIALGFQGKYRIMDHGATRLEQLNQGLYETIRGQRGEYETELSPHWRGEQASGERRSPLLLWIAGLAALGLLLALYMLLSYLLNGDSDIEYRRVAGIGRNVALNLDRAPVEIPEQKGWWVEFEVFLEEEIRRGILEVVQERDLFVIRVFNKGLFGSGSATVSEDYARLFERIGDAIERQVPGPVVVIGHSDNVPINTVAFPSNWHLSTARAAAVASSIAPSLSDPDRLTYEGRSDTEPVAGNDSTEGRASNRRVEITLRKIISITRIVPAE